MKQYFEIIKKIKPQQLADFIINEHPQTIAVILLYCEDDYSAELLNYFSSELNTEILMRIANLGEINSEILEIVSHELNRTLEELTKENVEISGVNKTQNILKKMLNNQNSWKTVDNIITYIEQIDSNLANNILNEMYDFSNFKQDLHNVSLMNIKSFFENLEKKENIVFINELKLEYFEIFQYLIDNDLIPKNILESLNEIKEYKKEQCNNFLKIIKLKIIIFFYTQKGEENE